MRLRELSRAEEQEDKPSGHGHVRALPDRQAIKHGQELLPGETPYGRGYVRLGLWV